MKMQRDVRQRNGQCGMTLLEVMVTLGVLSIFFMGTLQFYSTTYKHLRTRESALDLLHDAHYIMSSLGKDIRQAENLVENFQELPARSVIAALKMAPDLNSHSGKMIVVYWLDRTRPTHLFRSVYRNGQESSSELSSLIQSLTIQPETDRLVSVQFTLQDRIAGQAATFQVSSAYAMRF